MYGRAPQSARSAVRQAAAVRPPAQPSINFDLYNALNGNAITSQNNNYAAWQVPLSILDARLFKISAQVDF